MRTIIKRRSVVVITSEVTTTIAHRGSDATERREPTPGAIEAESDRLLLTAGFAEAPEDNTDEDGD